MCFSATASFIAGVSLSVLGVATVKKVKRKAEIPFAMIPLLFGEMCIRDSYSRDRMDHNDCMVRSRIGQSIRICLIRHSNNKSNWGQTTFS